MEARLFTGRNQVQTLNSEMENRKDFFGKIGNKLQIISKNFIARCNTDLLS